MRGTAVNAVDAAERRTNMMITYTSTGGGGVLSCLSILSCFVSHLLLLQTLMSVLRTSAAAARSVSTTMAHTNVNVTLPSMCWPRMDTTAAVSEQPAVCVWGGEEGVYICLQYSFVVLTLVIVTTDFQWRRGRSFRCWFPIVSC